MTSHCRIPPISAVVVLSLAVMSAACSTSREPLAPLVPRIEQSHSTLKASLVASELDVGLGAPPVALGDTFVYDNPPEKLTVTALDGPFIGWASSTGDIVQTSWSTLLPPLRWSGDKNPLNVGQRRITQLTGKFFPLKKGNRVTFLEDAVYARPGTVERGSWQCDVGDRAEITVVAGKAQAWEVLCMLNGHEKHIMYYAENLGRSIRTVTQTESGVSVRQLTGYARGRTKASGTGEAKPTDKVPQ